MISKIKLYLVLFLALVILSCGSSSGTLNDSDNNLIGGTEVGNPPDLEKVREIKGQLDGSIDCIANRVVVKDTSGFERSFPIDKDCGFDFELKTGKAYSLSFYDDDELIMVLTFHDGHRRNQEYFYLSDGEDTLDLGIIIQSEEMGISSENPASQNDRDRDGINDFEDSDDDNDGVLDEFEEDCDQDGIDDDDDLNLECPPLQEDNNVENQGEQRPNNFDDTDGDGIGNLQDNCTFVSNSDQRDLDEDGQGDACDDDIDGDGYTNDKDNCSSLLNPSQFNTDGDQQGDLCDNDPDNDSLTGQEDNCPLIQNLDQLDDDGDGIGNRCDFLKLVGGIDYNCALREFDGSIVCWGQETNKSWQVEFDDNQGFIDIAASQNHTCAIKREDFGIYCWGADDYGSGRYNIKLEGRYSKLFLSVNEYHSKLCAISVDGRSSFCWRYLVRNNEFIFPEPDFFAARISTLSISADPSADVCGVTSAGSLYCEDSFFQRMNVPDGNYKSVSVFRSGACAITENEESITCWSYDRDGLVVERSLHDYPEDNAPNNEGYQNIYLIDRNACAIKSASGELFCWGDDQEKIDFLMPKEDIPNQGFSSLSIQDDHVCALKRDGQLLCWGSNGDQRSTPPDTFENPNSNYHFIDVGFKKSCAIKNNGYLSCWGDFSDFGDNQTIPESIESLRFRKVRVSKFYACAIALADSRLYCWGNLNRWEEEIPSFLDQTVYDLDIHYNSYNLCVIFGEDQSIRCWGREEGLYQNNGEANSNYSSLTFGSHSCAIKEPLDHLGCWHNFSFINDLPSEAYHKIESSRLSTCAIQGLRRRLICWGSSENLHLVLRDFPDFGDESFLDVGVGSGFVCASRVGEDNETEMSCRRIILDIPFVRESYQNWGQHIMPSSRGRVVEFSSFSAGKNHVCGIEESQGKVICWGSNGSGAAFVPSDL